VHFDTGNIMMYQYPEHWIPILGDRIRNVHLKEFTKKGTDTSLEAFRPLLDGTTNWPVVMDALGATGYSGYVTFEYFHPYEHYPEALVFQTSDSLDRMLGRKAYVPG
jgi:hexulose-6-phosphate isomerase